MRHVYWIMTALLSCCSVWAFSITNIAQLSTTGPARGIYGNGSYIYVAAGTSLQIVNVSDSAHPTLVGSCSLPGSYAIDVYVSGSYAYIADYQLGLQIVNVSDPANPSLVGSYNTPGLSYGVFVSGSYAYVADTESGGLQIINVSDPAHPTLAGSYDTPGCAYDVYVSGSYAYVADEYTGLLVFNVSDPAHPVLIGSYDTPGRAVRVQISGSYAYVSDFDGLYIINVSDPAHPSLVGSCALTTVCSVYVSGSYAYLSSDDKTIKVVDVSDPAHPILVASCTTLGGSPDGVYVNGSYAFLGAGDAGLLVFRSSSSWVQHGYKWGWDGLNSGSWQYTFADSGNAMEGRVWGPISGNTYGAEAWWRTIQNFNDGNFWQLTFTLDTMIGYNPHYDPFGILISDTNYTDTIHSPLIQTDPPAGSVFLWRSGTDYCTVDTPHVPFSDQTFTVLIDPLGTAKLYTSAGTNSSPLRTVNLDLLKPWHLKFELGDATSGGFTAGDNTLRVSNFVFTSWSVTTSTAPTGVSATDGTFTDKVQVTWSSVSGASFYEVWRSANNNTAGASKLGTTAGTTYDDLTAASTPGTILYYWVKARTLVSVSEFSYPDSGYCRPSTPSGSADLSISSVLFDPVVIQQGQHPGLLMLMLANNGPDAMNSSSVNFAFYMSANDIFGDGDDQWMGDYNTNTTITVGSYTTVILSEVGLSGVTIPPVADGNYYVFAKVQHSSTLTDPDENNNVCKRMGTILIGATAGLKIPISGDFDGDKKTDLALYQEATGTWQIMLSGNGYGLLEVPGLGGSGLAALTGDFDGDGKDDPATYNEATGDWTVWKSKSGYVPATVNLGGLGFKPVIGDYNGGGMEDLAVYQEARGYWLIILSETTALSYYSFGADGYIPVTGDYDGDGKTDMALYEQSTGNWLVKLSSAGGVEVSLGGFGGTGYVPVIADYDGDGLADLALYHETTGKWMVRLSAAGYLVAGLEEFGGSGYVPVPGDFDGDGLADLVIYETATSTWIFRLSTMGYAPLSVAF